MNISYSPIGYVKSPIKELLRPEEIRTFESKIILEQSYVNAIKELAMGQYIIVVYHLETKKHNLSLDWIKRRTSDRPNPIGITLAQIVHIENSIIAVIGLDAIDSTSIYAAQLSFLLEDLAAENLP